MTAGTGVTHPAVQVAAISSIALGLPSNWGLYLAVPGALYYAVLLLNELRSLAPDPKSLPGKLYALWLEDKPYLVALGGLAYALAEALHYPIPTWGYVILASLGIATLHSQSKGTTKP